MHDGDVLEGRALAGGGRPAVGPLHLQGVAGLTLKVQSLEEVEGQGGVEEVEEEEEVDVMEVEEVDVMEEEEVIMMVIMRWRRWRDRVKRWWRRKREEEVGVMERWRR